MFLCFYSTPSLSTINQHGDLTPSDCNILGIRKCLNTSREPANRAILTRLCISYDEA